MDFDTLNALRTIHRLDTRLAGEEVSPVARPRLEACLAELRSAQTSAGHDAEALLTARSVFAEKRRIAAFGTNPSLHGADIRQSGYLIPSPPDDAGRAMGYIVAEVGMCSHMPPPPPNQLLRLRLPDGFSEMPVYAPVQITGKLTPHASARSQFLLDGQARMVSQWLLSASHVDRLDG
ncbi:MAG: DUF3299 domain-containing protein [Pseudomonadota bacterium]